MPDRRAPLIPLSAVAGLASAALAWLAFGGHSAALAHLAEVEGRLTPQAAPLVTRTAAADDAAGRILSSPIFALTTGPGAVSEADIKLQGLAITPSRRAALLAINGKPAVWLKVGDSQEGVTVMEVQGSKVSLDTATGIRDVGISDAAQPPAAAGPAPAAPGGFRLPPPATPAGR